MFMKLFGSKKNLVQTTKPVAMLEDLEGRSMMAATLPTTTKLGISTEFAKLGESIALAARVGKVAPDTTTPTGRAAFYINGTLLGSKRINSLGVARWTIPVLFNGSYSLKAIYSGDATHLGHRSGARSLAVSTPTLTTSQTGLQYATVVTGSGSATLTNGSPTNVDYTGFLTNGSIFDSGNLSGFTVGQFVPGFNEGLIGMKTGETRLLIIPPNLGYGSQANGSIPANSTLVFVVKVISI